MKLPEPVRYQIHIIRSADGRTLGDTLMKTDDRYGAYHFALWAAMTYQWGVGIVDNKDQIVDLGDEIVPLSEITISEPS